jgi:hypothetical protein
VLRPLLAPSPENVPPQETVGASAWVDPADVLAVTLDLAGSMKLAAHLQGRVSRLGEDPKKARMQEAKARDLMDAGDAPRERDEPADEAAPELTGSRTGEAVQELRTELLGRFHQLRTSVLRRMDEVQSGRSRIADALRLAGDLEAKNLLARRNPRGIGAVGRSGVESYLLVVFNCLDRVRGEVRTIRSELAPGVAGLSSEAARLEAFDALLCAARFRFTAQLFARIPAALGDRFALQLQAAVKSLPASPEPCDFEAWYAADGWVSEFHGLARRIVAATLEHEWTALAGWVEAAIEVEATRNAGTCWVRI